MHHILLLPELRERILSFCSLAALKELSQCSHRANDMVKANIWSHFTLPWDWLVNLQPHCTETWRTNLHLTKSIHFGDSHIFEDRRHMDVMTKNFLQVLEFFNVDAVRSFFINYLPLEKTVLTLSCTKLKQVTRVTIRDGESTKAHVFECLTTLVHLVELDLYATQLNDSVLMKFCENLLKLRILNVGGTLVTDAGIAHLDGLPRLQCLNVSDLNELTNKSLSVVSGFVCLRQLDLSWCRKITDEGVNRLNKFRHMEKLDLCGCRKVGDGAMGAISTMTSLHTLNMQSCILTDHGIQQLCKLPHLKDVNVSHTGIADPGVIALSLMPCLQRLNLSKCKGVTDVGFSVVVGMKTLIWMNVKNTNVTEIKVFEFERTKKIDILHSFMKEMASIETLHATQT